MNLPIVFYTCAPISEIPSNIIVFGYNVSNEFFLNGSFTDIL